MEELLKSNCSFYFFATAFAAIWVLSFIYVIFKKTKQCDSQRIKALLRVGVSSILVCLWAYLFVYIQLYPISLAYSEYMTDKIEERICTIDNVEQKSKDRIYITADNTEFTMIPGSIDSFASIGKGDTVKITYGEKSMFIFDIIEDETFE